MMKIAVITAATNTIPRFRIDMIDEFVRRGCEVVVFGDEPAEKWEGYFAEHVTAYRQYSVSRNGLNPMSDIATLKELEYLLLEARPDKVFTYQAKPNIYGVIAAHRARIKGVFVMMGGLGSVFHADDSKSKIVRRIVAAEYKHALSYADKVFFQNAEDVGLFDRLGLVDRAKVVMVRGSGVNIDHFAQKPLPDKPSFLFVGRLVKGKGIREYLEAARIVKQSHPEASFAVVGPFDTNPTSMTPEELQAYVDDGTVVFHGEQEDVRPFLEACSVLVLPSYYGEGTPKSALEAMATGRPLIVADAVGCREVVRKGENGILVSPKSATALVEAMVHFIEHPQMVFKMGLASRGLAEERFDVWKVNGVIATTMGIM